MSTTERSTKKVAKTGKIAVNRSPGQLLTPMKVIRSQCLGCCCNQVKEVALCTCTTCPNWPYRFGTGTRAQKIVNEELAAGIAPDETHWAEKLPDYTGQHYYEDEYGSQDAAQ